MFKMRVIAMIYRFALLSSVTLTATVPALAAHRTAHHLTTSHKLLSRHIAPKPRFQSQRAMDDDRAAQIQYALIHAGYLSGSPTGHWDNESEAAMQKLQSDNGWQTKIIPDSRALIKLGLGASATPSTASAPVSSLVPAPSPSLLAQSTY